MKRYIVVLLFCACLIGFTSYSEDLSSESPLDVIIDFPTCIPPLKSDISYPLSPSSYNADSVAFSPNGFYLATANEVSHDITMYQVGAGGALTNWKSYKLPISGTISGKLIKPHSLVFSPDGLYLAVLTTDNQQLPLLINSHIVIYEVGPQGALINPKIYTIEGSTQNARSLIFSPNRPYLAVAVQLYNTGGRFVVVYSIDGGLLVDPTFYSIPLLPNSFDINPSMAFSPNGSYLAVARSNTNSSASDVIVFTMSAGGVLSGGGVSFPSSSASSSISSIAFSPNGAYLAMAGTGSNDVTIYKVNGDVLSNRVSKKLPAGSQHPSKVAFSPNSSYIATSNVLSHDRTLFKVEAGGLLDGKSFRLPTGSLTPISIAFSRDGRYLASANYNSRDVTILKGSECAPWGLTNAVLKSVQDILTT